MKEIDLGTFFAQPLVLKVQDNLDLPDDWDWKEQWKEWLKSEKGQAVKEYKNSILLEQIGKEAERKFKVSKLTKWLLK